MLESIRSSATSALTRATRCNIQNDGISHCYGRENLKSYYQVLVQSTENILLLTLFKIYSILLLFRK
jgi:hypothetical protein